MSTMFHGMLMIHIITLYLPTKMSGLTAARMGAGIQCIQAAERGLKVSEKLVLAEVHSCVKILSVQNYSLKVYATRMNFLLT